MLTDEERMILAEKWVEVKETSMLALEKRIGLWDAIEEKIAVKTEMV